MNLKEDKYPVEDRGPNRGRPDLRCYTDSLAYYVNMYEQFLDTIEGRKQGVGYEPDLAFKRRVHAMWGLIAKGVEAIPYALTLLRRPEAEAREDAAAILETVGKENVVVDELLKSLNSETDITVKDSLVIAVGRLKSRKAIPLLAKIIRDQVEDRDTRWTAVESLGLIVRRRFLDQNEPIQSAIDWLAKHPEDTHEVRE
jgi:hypothetical protein